MTKHKSASSNSQERKHALSLKYKQHYMDFRNRVKIKLEEYENETGRIRQFKERVKKRVAKGEEGAKKAGKVLKRKLLGVTLAVIATANPLMAGGSTFFVQGNHKDMQMKQADIAGYYKRDIAKGKELYDKQIALIYEKDAKELRYEFNLSKNKKTATFVNGLMPNGTWYQVGMGYDWPINNLAAGKISGQLKGFSLQLDFWDKNNTFYVGGLKLNHKDFNKGNRVSIEIIPTSKPFPNVDVRVTDRFGKERMIDDPGQVLENSLLMVNKEVDSKSYARSLDVKIENFTTGAKIVLSMPYEGKGNFIKGVKDGKFTGLMTESYSKPDYAFRLKPVEYVNMSHENVPARILINEQSLHFKAGNISFKNYLIIYSERLGEDNKMYYIRKYPLNRPVAYYDGVEFITGFTPK